ncbi:MAG: hypothetical protein AB7V27_04030 [Candidatus Binatia bacterium]
MRTVKWNPFLSAACAVLGGMILNAGLVRADVTSDRPAGLIVVPKLVFDSSGVLGSGTGSGNPVDTEIQLTNTSDVPVRLRCFYVNANSHCSNFVPARVCSTPRDCVDTGNPANVGLCIEGWIETDFNVTLTPRQPIIWTLSDGLPFPPLSFESIPGATEDPFMGELKCVQVGPNDEPIDRNDVKAEATIIQWSSNGVDARAYNGIGIQAIQGANDGNNTLVLGGDDPEYNGCPNILILNHFFDNAQEPVNDHYLKTHLTCVPCSQNFLLQDVALFPTTLQFLVFNEFEQRFSASRRLRCFKEFELCTLGTGVDRPFNNDDYDYADCDRSIFSSAVSGTLAGQTRIRGVDDGATDHGNGVLCVAEEFYRDDFSDLSSVRSSTAFNLHWAGVRTTEDLWTLP